MKRKQDLSHNNMGIFIIVCCFTLMFFVKSIYAASQNKMIHLSTAQQDTVILLHGLARSDSSMKPVKNMLEKNGYNVININYPSTKKSIEHIAEEHLKPVIDMLPPSSGKIHFVTHSMGGIVVRQYLNNNKISNLGRVVMLAPPNKGSELVDTWIDNVAFKTILGPAAQQLSTSPHSLPKSLGTPYYAIGVIAGSSSFNPVASFIFKTSHDGKVTVEGTRLYGMRDHITTPYTHTFIIGKDDVHKQIVNFLKEGRFKRYKYKQGNTSQSL
ncbi:MAG: alpha/beta hydrolase [Desulfotalea sp.]